MTSSVARAKPAPAAPPSRPLRGLLLVCLVAVAYFRALGCGFIWDDDQYVTENPALRTLAGLRHIWFTPSATPQYYPLVHTSFWLEYHLWGLAPLGYHLVNVLLHGLAAWLFYKTLLRLRVPGAWLAAAIFALHPVMVESVAWVTERKNVLSAVFYFASALAYFRFNPPEEAKIPGKPQWKWHGLALLFFAAALLSKTVTCSLPATLLVVYWWKRGKVRWPDARPLLPFFAIGACLGLVTAWMERHHVGAEGADWTLSVAQRFLIAGRALWFYAGKLVWPARLTFIYPRWDVDAGQWWQWLFPAAALAALAALWFMRHRVGRGPLAAALVFAGTLGPALGFINLYPMRYSFVADHFQYLAAIGLITLFAGWAVRWPRWGVALLLATLGALTWLQTGMYRDAETLWRTTLVRNPNALIARSKLGVILLQQGRVEEAAAQFRAVLQAQPGSVDPLCNLGMILFQNGKTGEAEACFQKALEIAPNYDMAHNGIGSVLLRQGHVDEAMDHFQRAVDLNPLNISARLNLGLALVQKNKWDDAAFQFEKCLDLDPESAPAHANLGDLFLKEGRVADSLVQYQAALALQPANPAILNDLAWIRAANSQARFRDGPEAVRLAERACQITDYRVPVILNTLAAAYAEAGRFEDAVATAEKARQAVLAMGHPEAAAQVLHSIQLYQSRQPYHESPPAPL
ncbi:MAG TPA: tetratricopeptide repeat protein [Candidatus Saccharimonadales bacterium]|nr:tetratricopeptide repeat protein [Candidatus Saccharimonadales bacterium]